uniref:DNA polymerase II subunit 2 n=1 Tax=Heterosigma akashiwo TaxID=2829 RepID=A0A7S3XUX9_HETAK
MMGMPPAEARGDALRAIAGGPHVDLFGKGGAGGQDQLARLEAEAQGQMVAILADVHLDLPEVLEKLKVLFAGFASCEPLPVFVLMGNFSSKSASMGVEGIEDMIESFTALSDLLASFPALCAEGRFVFVPGPGDPGHGNVLPRMPLPRPLRQALGRRLPHAVFATNPCRLRVYTQELVLFREDLLRKMQRHALVQQDKEAPDSDATETLVATLLAQGHLCPLPLPARPIHWKADPALQLYPLPHAVVLADQTDQYKWTYEDCHAFNPGSFPTDFSFIVYTPATQDVEFSKIDD